MTLKNRIATALIAGSIVGATVLPAAALADTSCEISGNGAHSHNSCRIRQSNSSTIRNRVSVDVDTGGNTANSNTGGDVSITTGDVHVDVTITNDVNQSNNP